MKLLVVAYNYPSRISPTRGIFLKKIIDEFVKSGVEVVVIAPHAIGSFFIKNLLKYLISATKYSNSVESITVYRPLVFSFGSSDIGVKWSHLCFEKVVFRIYETKCKNYLPDAIYSHFIYPAGMTAVSLAKKLCVKSFIAVGEDNLKHIPKADLSRSVLEADGLISVSYKNKSQLMALSSINEQKIIVAPNSVDFELFHRKNSITLRKKYGFNVDDFILVFTGYFDERKGIQRVMNALEGLDSRIKIIILGEGPQKPNKLNNRILFCDRVENYLLPEYLSCGDAFILPTLSEGSCNAIYEAMACGLPIISSKIPEIEEQVNSKNSILVDPTNVVEIRNAICTFFNNPDLVKIMSDESLRISRGYSLRDRSDKILSFIKSTLNL